MSHTKYTLAKRIARGGMAEIYLGKATGGDGFQKICAIKRILPHYAQDKEFVAMFRDEAHICKRLQHNNIVQVYDFTEVEQSYAIIMEYIDGSDLRSILSTCESSQVKLTTAMAIYIAAEALKGLHYAHTRIDEVTKKPLVIIHRDISPQNIMVSYEGEVKIFDFGIADAESKITETRPGIVKGKYSYMSPEQVNAKTLDPRSDVFSLSIVLWEMLAMRRLFASDTEVQTIKKVQNAEIQFNLMELNKEIDQDLMIIIDKGLERDRKKRYASADEMSQALYKYLHKHFPDFTDNELGAFLKKVLEKKRDESLDEIKRTLTETSFKPSAYLQESAQVDNKKIDLEIEQQDQVLAVSKPRTATNPNITRMNQPAYYKTAYKVGSTQSKLQNPWLKPEQTATKKSHFNIIKLIIATIVALTFILIIKKYNDSVATMQVIIETLPENVKLILNNKPINNSTYIKTPVKLNVPAGFHTLRISRAGYRSEVIQFKGASGEVIKQNYIVLNKKHNVQFAPTKITLATKQALYIDINNGFFTGTAPTALDDLRYGKQYTIEVLPNYPHKKDSFKCSFTPKSLSFKQPVIVHLNGDASEPAKKCMIFSP